MEFLWIWNSAFVISGHLMKVHSPLTSSFSSEVQIYSRHLLKIAFPAAWSQRNNVRSFTRFCCSTLVARDNRVVQDNDPDLLAFTTWRLHTLAWLVILIWKENRVISCQTVCFPRHQCLTFIHLIWNGITIYTIYTTYNLHYLEVQNLFKNWWRTKAMSLKVNILWTFIIRTLTIYLTSSHDLLLHHLKNGMEFGLCWSPENFTQQKVLC